MADYSFMSEDQARVYQQILSQYSNEEQYGKLYKEITVKPVEGSDKVVVTFINQRRNGLEIYLPSKIDSTMPSYTYYSPGGLADRGESGGYVLDNAIESTLKESNNAILCITSGDDKENFGLNSIEAIFGENGFNSNTCIGWSLGGYTAYNTTLEKIRNNPNLEPQTMILLDVQYNGSSLVTNEENLALLKENGTTIMAFESIEVAPEQFRNSQNYKAMAAAGIPLVIIEMQGNHSGSAAATFKGDLFAFLNGEIDTIPQANGFYTFDENGNYIELDSQTAIDIMRKNIASLNTFGYSKDDFSQMIIEFRKQISMYSSSIDNKLSSISNMMSEFLTTDAGFIANQIQDIVSVCESSEIRDMSVLNNYNSTTSSPSVQDAKMLEYKAKVLSLFENVLSCIDLTMNNQLEIERTEQDISNEASSLSGKNNKIGEDILAATYIGLASAADALGYTGDKKQEYIDKNMQQYYKQCFIEEATISAESQGLEGKAKEEYIDNYMSGRIEKFKESVDSYEVEVDTTSHTTTNKPEDNNSTQTSNQSTSTQSQHAKTKPISSSSNSSPIDKISSSRESIDEFPEYNSIVSDENTDVFNSKDSNYKIIINHDNNKVTEVEHYFDFKTHEEAISNLKNVTNTYDPKDIKSIDCSGQYVKVRFNDFYFNSKSYTEFISKYDVQDKVIK